MRSPRFLFVLLLSALVAAALAAGRASSAPPQPANVKVAPSAAVLARSGTVWFCPGLPPALAHASARVTFANIGDSTADVVVTDLADNGAVTHVTIRVAADSVLTKARDQLGGAGALTVESFGGRVLVEEGIEGPQALDTTPCATESSAHWYFAAGTTPRGVQQWLVIDNPYASDAKVDVTLRTSSGVHRPGALQSLDIARRSREVVAIHDISVREDRVAVAIDAEVGSVVAAQTLVYTTAAGTPGVALSLGSPTAAADWTFAGGVAEPGSTAVLAIANVGPDAAQVDVQATAESSKQPLAPVNLTVAQDDVAWVQLGQCVAASGKACVNIAAGVRYSLVVRSEQNVSIVAQTLTRFDDAPDIVGTVTAPGLFAPARGWAFARSRVNGERSTTLSLFNPGADAAVVGVGLVHDGRVERPSALQRVTVPPGRAVTVTVVGGRQPSRFDAALTINASEPIFVERSIVATEEAASSVGVVVG
ncbi:MAG: DUF5719 family protein [Actinomycetota bacterium]|nr:DUF5719 family protein [Actinomycetota bacterium]